VTEELMSKRVASVWLQAALWGLSLERIDAGAMLEYFEPLKNWLDQQNRGHRVGW
jgi:peptidyl-dipeptidase A